MGVYHRLIIQLLMRHYADWAPANLAKEPEVSQFDMGNPVSKTEKMRIIRSLYRFCLCRNLFVVLEETAFSLQT
jgi:hypothetical protein